MSAPSNNSGAGDPLQRGQSSSPGSPRGGQAIAQSSAEGTETHGPSAQIHEAATVMPMPTTGNVRAREQSKERPVDSLCARWSSRLRNPRTAIASWKSEARSRKFWQACWGEFVGMTFFLMIVSTAVVFSFPAASSSPDGPGSSLTRTVLISAGFGLSIAVLVFSLAHISGGHLNPAVSLVLWLRGGITAFRFVMYSWFQMAGATAGAGLAKSLNPGLYTAAGGAANSINRSLFAGMDTWTALGAEWFATGILCFCVLASTHIGLEPTTKRIAALNPLIIGLAVFLAHLALIPIDGTSINPARSFGAAAVSGIWTDQWIWWVGPCLGSVLALVT